MEKLKGYSHTYMINTKHRKVETWTHTHNDWYNSQDTRLDAALIPTYLTCNNGEQDMLIAVKTKGDKYNGKPRAQKPFPQKISPTRIAWSVHQIWPRPDKIYREHYLYFLPDSWASPIQWLKPVKSPTIKTNSQSC